MFKRKLAGLSVGTVIAVLTFAGPALAGGKWG